MINVPEEVEAKFRAAGWKPGRLNPGYFSNQATSNSHANAVLQKFGGLNVGTCGPGHEMATSNIHFLASPTPAKSIAVSKWQDQLGPLTPVADAHNDHMVVYVSEAGEYYFFTDPDEKLYFAGLNFGEATCRLLLGRSFGPEVEPNRSFKTDTLCVRT
ncbi:hypothetical protein HA050_08395 [Iodobacter sp. HSC-16F04]|uniref:Uncharacterized protein n=1 Tax=Iodobacter violaceini TaxID=3044271 RepID=A0ABX0KQN5_9NEIS|nr:SUKH-3 domain-containing protein [Iodobacter violacea]NHQ86136.1 hypothetical protein [Iodobacter violacea]